MHWLAARCHRHGSSALTMLVHDSYSSRQSTQAIEIVDSPTGAKTCTSCYTQGQKPDCKLEGLLEQVRHEACRDVHTDNG